MHLLKCKDELRNIQYAEFCWLWFFYLHAQTLLCMLFLFVPLPFCVFWAGVGEHLPNGGNWAQRIVLIV